MVNRVQRSTVPGSEVQGLTGEKFGNRCSLLGIQEPGTTQNID